MSSQLKLSDDGDSDLALLSIPVKPIFEEFQCPICMNVIADAHITPCGHNFCKTCIYECLNRKHQCPYCNLETVKERTVKNHHLDKLIAIVKQQKEDASKRYFERLIRQQRTGLTSSDAVASVVVDNTNGSAAAAATSSSPSPAVSKRPSTSGLSPIEELFHKHMKKSLAVYQDYCRELKEKNDRQQEQLMKEFAMKMALAGASESKLLALKSECDTKILQLQNTFNVQMKMLLDAYDKYMSDFAPKPTILPVTVSVSIPSKSILLSNIMVRPTDTPRQLREVVRERLAQMGTAVVTWAPSNVFVWRKDGRDEIIMDESVPVVMKRIDPGAVLEIRGEVHLKGDEPKMCFASTFKAGDKMDYFRCNTCDMNWVCKSCAESCHKPHALVPYLKDHTPGWNCCYCTKYKKCTLPTANAKK